MKNKEPRAGAPDIGGYRMKPLLVTTTALALCWAAAAGAGTYAEPLIEPQVVEVASSSSSAGVAVPVLLFLLFAAALGGGGGGAPSDVRLKEAVTRVGTTHLGLPLYRFRYRGLPQVFEGVMAQDVACVAPGAVRRLPFGYLAVDYAALGLEMRQVA